MFKKIADMESKHQIIFAILIGFAVVSFWRGIWGLSDIYLFPANEVLSLFSSVLIGVGILIITQYITRELM